MLRRKVSSGKDLLADCETATQRHQDWNKNGQPLVFKVSKSVCVCVRGRDHFSSLLC